MSTLATPKAYPGFAQADLFLPVAFSTSVILPVSLVAWRCASLK
jgi:hypothetical protein